jgi:hypothetical protein
MKGTLTNDETGSSVEIAFRMDSDGYRYQMVLADEEDIYKNELFVYESMMDGAE